MKLAWVLALMLSAAPARAGERLRIAVLGVRASDQEAALRAEARLIDGLRAGGAEVAASESISRVLGFLTTETLVHCVIVQDGTCALSPVLDGVDLLVVAELRHYDEQLRIHIASADGQRLRQDEFEGDSFPALLAMLRGKATRLAKELHGVELEEEVDPDEARLAARIQGPPSDATFLPPPPVTPEGRTQTLSATLPSSRTTVLAAVPPPAPPTRPETAADATPAVAPGPAAAAPPAVTSAASPPAAEAKPEPEPSRTPVIKPAPKPATVVAAAPRKTAKAPPAPPPPKPAVKSAPPVAKGPRAGAGADPATPPPVVRPSESKYRVVRHRIPGGPWPVLATGIGLTGLSGIFAANAGTSARILESPGDSGPRSARHAAELRDALARDTTVAIVLGIAGAAGVTTGIVLLALTPGQVQMTVTPTGTGLNLSGTF